ncbi:MAG TPA: hypothetical protein VGO09_01790 [Flavisolibacter sp.]|nr:hypothetical protein [Flavisolibacter sp.]
MYKNLNPLHVIDTNKHCIILSYVLQFQGNDKITEILFGNFSFINGK